MRSGQDREVGGISSVDTVVGTRTEGNVEAVARTEGR